MRLERAGDVAGALVSAWRECRRCGGHRISGRCWPRAVGSRRFAPPDLRCAPRHQSPAHPPLSAAMANVAIAVPTCAMHENAYREAGRSAIVVLVFEGCCRSRPWGGVESALHVGRREGVPNGHRCDACSIRRAHAVVKCGTSLPVMRRCPSTVPERHPQGRSNVVWWRQDPDVTRQSTEAIAVRLAVRGVFVL